MRHTSLLIGWNIQKRTAGCCQYTLNKISIAFNVSRFPRIKSHVICVCAREALMAAERPFARALRRDTLPRIVRN